MKNLSYTFIILILAFLYAACSSNNHQSVFHPKGLWLDNNGVHINAHGGGMLYNNGIYYWFGEHKIEGEAGNIAHVGVHCYSSENLQEWTDEGIALSVAPEGSGSDIEKGCILERPKVVYNAATKKYVMWFHLELKGEEYSAARSGVAISDKITGPYNFIRSLRPNGEMARDMTVFIDDDATAYHIFSSEDNKTTHIAELSDDYLSHTGKYVRVFPERYMEAPAVFKRNGNYYFIGSGCTGWAPNAARSAIAQSIWGPWTELGNPCRGENAELTFGAQSTYVQKVHGKEDLYIFMADEWRPENAIDGRYVWLPISFEEEKPVINWQTEWKMD
ncbi:glycoside hydrolase family 43 protein [Bacteroides sp. 51]|uniref:glycoside hydrolase family 43 protein n=1 Tax=Bacteroides sp. 51 TaxID=2302938 RepID=UPI0013D4241A|nr:glycoside hydrolase family 43 protein [Bacteroides sp. 51]NDV81905.1 beta-glucanase [Bacteroides sp. 51]